MLWRWPRVADLCAWRVDPPTPAQRLGRALAVPPGAALALIGKEWPPDVPGQRWHGPPMPVDRDTPLSFRVPMFADGSPSWLAPRRAWHVWFELTRGRALVHVPHGFETDVVALPLKRLQLAGASPTRWTPTPYYGRIPWRLVLVERDPAPADRESGQLVVSGPWVAMAWLGTLARWPQPEPGPRVPAP